MGDVVKATGGRPAQVRKANAIGAAARRQFLQTLAATCNVLRAAQAVGVNTRRFYHLRMRDPAFATAWSEALAYGYERLEEALLAHATGSVMEYGNGDGTENGMPDVADTPFRLHDPQMAHAMLLRQDTLRRRGSPVGRSLAVVAMADVEQALLKQINKLARQLGQR